MKRVKLIIEELPNDYTSYTYKARKYKPLKLVELSDLETISIDAPEYEISNLEFFAYGRYREGFYITQEQGMAFEHLFHGFIDQAKKDLLSTIIENINFLADNEKTVNEIIHILFELKKSIKGGDF